MNDNRPVWDTARIREAFIDDGGLSEYHDPINGARTQRLVMGDIFDAWLEEVKDNARHNGYEDGYNDAYWNGFADGQDIMR